MRPPADSEAATPADLAAALNAHPLMAQLLWQRGLRTVADARAFLDPFAFRPAPPTDLPDVGAAAARLSLAIETGQSIWVWGDFDADGQTATSVLWLGLRALGARVSFIIPDRARHSHGLNRDGLVRAKNEGASIVLTCDCGVTDFDEIRFARALGLDVIVSDHHDLGAQLPDALAIVNPKRLPPNHALATLPGVGVAVKLIEALAPEVSATLLDLAALGIVADVAYLRGDTRQLLQLGLLRLRDAPRVGLRALMKIAKLDPAKLDADDIAFQLGPRLNAAGRLDSANLSVKLLTADDPAEAAALAAKIEELNVRRKVLQRRAEDEAMRMIERDPSLARNAVIVLQSPDWHPSLVGVVASSLAHRFGKPAVLISATPGEIGRGSARSVEGVDIHAAIAAQAQLITSSGGHPMAAGFGIRAENIPAFRDAVSAHARAQFAALPASDDVSSEPAHDAVVGWSDVTPTLCAQLERLAPFGAGNPRPIFLSRGLRIVRSEPLGRGGAESAHRAVWLRDESGQTRRAAWWNSASRKMPDEPVSVTFTMQLSAHAQRPRVELAIEAVVAKAERAGPTDTTVTARFGVDDRRGSTSPAGVLRELEATHGAHNVQIWAEASSVAGGRSRTALTPMPVLVIYDPPPDAATLKRALDTAAPRTVVLLCQPPTPQQHEPQAVLAAVQGMLKAAASRGDDPDDPRVVARMAARIGQREEALRAGVAYARAPSPERLAAVRFWLEETRAYRAYFQAASASAVLSA